MFQINGSVDKIEKGDIGFSPLAVHCAHYVIHDYMLEDGYFGHNTNGVMNWKKEPNFNPESIGIELKGQLEPIAAEYENRNSDLLIVVGGMRIRKHPDSFRTPEKYQRFARCKVEGVFRDLFPYVTGERLQLRFNDGPGLFQHMVYTPPDGIVFLNDDEAKKICESMYPDLLPFFDDKAWDDNL